MRPSFHTLNPELSELKYYLLESQIPNGKQYIAIRQDQLLRNVEFQVYEKNADVGGTWFENKYRKLLNA